MPSPIAHSVVGLALGRLLPPLRGRGVKGLGLDPLVAVAVVVLALLPDLGSVAGILTGDFGRFHNSWEHSLIAGVLSAAVIGVVAGLAGSPRAARWFLAGLLCYESHVLMDFLTWGRGVKILWPLSTARFQPPVYLFYGLHWSQGWLSSRHAVTLATELIFVAFVVVVTHRAFRGTLISSKSDTMSRDKSLGPGER